MNRVDGFLSEMKLPKSYGWMWVRYALDGQAEPTAYRNAVSVSSESFDEFL